MIPKIVMSPGNRYGRSFKGLVNYISSDTRDPDTGVLADRRVSHTYVRNLPSDSPSVAWQVMAATAMNRDELKRSAGIKPGGRADKGEVMHLILNWDASERETLTREQIDQAANDTVRELGLGEHQVYGKVHDQPGKHPHLHLAINRVHPETGKIASDYKSQKKLSKWALEYERSRDGVLVPGREANWKAREQGLELPRQPAKNRADFEADKAARGSAAIRDRVAEHRAERERFARQRAEHRRRGEAYRESAFELHNKRGERANAQAEQIKADARKRIERAFFKQHQRLIEEHRGQAERFEQSQQSFIGRFKNRIVHTDWRQAGGDQNRHRFSRLFNAWSEPGFPRAQLDKRQQQELDELHRYRSAMHERREQRVDGLLRQRTARLRNEHAKRIARFDAMQKQNAARLEDERKRLDRQRRLLTKLGREAERARDLVQDSQRPSVAAARAFGQEEEKQKQEDSRCAAAMNQAATPATAGKRRGDNSQNEEPPTPTKRKRIRRPRKPRSGTKRQAEERPQTSEPKNDGWETKRDERGGFDEQER